MKELQISRHAEKQLSKLPKSEAKKILIKLKESQYDFSNLDIKKLKGIENSWRLRIGNYRVIFKIENDFLIVTEIGDRKDIYK